MWNFLERAIGQTAYLSRWEKWVLCSCLLAVMLVMLAFALAFGGVAV